jgi:hypothetical protein
MMTTTVSARRIPSGSVEFLSVWVDTDGVATLSSQPVAIALTPLRSDPDDDTTWRGASWAGSAATARSAAILIGPGTSHEIDAGKYEVWVKVTDNPETPIVHAGRLTIF